MTNTKSKHPSYKDSLITHPEMMTALAQGSLFLSQGLFDKAEPLLRSIPKDFAQYHVAVNGLFNLLWVKDTKETRLEAMQLINEFLEEADRENPDVKPVVVNFLKIKIDLLKQDEWFASE